MGTINSDKAWKAYGKKNPYYGVLTHDEYLDENLSEENRRKFFETGFHYTEQLFETIHKYFDADFKPEHTLDFGCGTGRLTIPLAQKSGRAVGLDVSRDMLEEAGRNAQDFEVGNVSFKLSDDDLTRIEGEDFDLINSFIVLQHINVGRGMKIIRRLVDMLNSGGVGVLHLTYSSNRTLLARWLTYLRYRLPLLNNIVNLIKGRAFNDPLMQMNVYDLNKVFEILQERNIHNARLNFEDHGGIWGVTLIFQKGKEEG